jgi:hypothetical protein
MNEIIGVLLQDLRQHTRGWCLYIPEEYSLSYGCDFVAQRNGESVGFHLRGSNVFVTYCFEEDSVCFDLADPNFFTLFYRYIRALFRWLDDKNCRRTNRFRESKYFRRLQLPTGRLGSGVNMYRS